MKALCGVMPATPKRQQQHYSVAVLTVSLSHICVYIYDTFYGLCIEVFKETCKDLPNKKILGKKKRICLLYSLNIGKDLIVRF